jgi:hypothetical protein
MYTSGCGYGSSGGAAHGGTCAGGAQQSYFPAEQLYAHASLDNIVSHASVEKPTRAIAHYVPGSAQGAYLASKTPHDYFIADTFLKPGSTARFVGDAAEIKQYIEEAFKATTGDELPKDIEIMILPDNEFRKAHVAHNGAWNEGSASKAGWSSSGAPSEGVQGFSLNSNGRGINKVFVRAAQLDRLMLTIGHEIGHVLTPSLKNPHDEEAKAFAFSLAWMNSIRERNVAGIGNNILPEPAQNGLHDTAFAFVQRIITEGTRAWDAFLQLARGTLTIREQPITVEV